MALADMPSLDRGTYGLLRTADMPQHYFDPDTGQCLRCFADAEDWEEGCVEEKTLALRARIEALEAERRNRPPVVCLCGSTRFMDAFERAGWEETLAGKIVLSVGVCKHVQTPDGGHVAEALGPEVVEALDELHKRKIDLADEVLILNVGGYIGESTLSEILYAWAHQKVVRWLEPRLVPRNESEARALLEQEGEKDAAED